MLKKLAQAGLMHFVYFVIFITIVVVILAIFGITPATVLPEKCSFGKEVRCENVHVSQNEIVLTIKNTKDRIMVIKDLTVSGKALGVGTGEQICSITTKDIQLDRNEKVVLNVDNPVHPDACTHRMTGKHKNIYSASLTYVWLDSQSITHVARGELLAKNP